jgi:hypothetical protein
MFDPKTFERVLRCRSCYRVGSAIWENTETGTKALLALTGGFHKRQPLPLSMPPEIVCDCGMVQPQ